MAGLKPYADTIKGALLFLLMLTIAGVLGYIVNENNPRILIAIGVCQLFLFFVVLYALMKEYYGIKKKIAEKSETQSTEEKAWTAR